VHAKLVNHSFSNEEGKLTTIFKWKRGAALSGWMMKWPLMSQAFGLPSRRFFVLRGSTLSYYNCVPAFDPDVSYTIIL
jgi:hypothetical protein